MCDEFDVSIRIWHAQWSSLFSGLAFFGCVASPPFSETTSCKNVKQRESPGPICVGHAELVRKVRFAMSGRRMRQQSVQE